MRILFILSPFFLAIGGLVYLQVGWFAPDAVDGQGTQVAAVQMELSGVTDVVARLPVATSAATSAQAPVTVPTQAAPSTSNTELQFLTSAVLANLGVQTAITATDPALASEMSSDLRALTSSVLLGLGNARPANTVPVLLDMSLEDVVSRAAGSSRTSDYITLLTSAAGSVAAHSDTPTYFSAANVAPDGRVNAAAIRSTLASLTSVRLPVHLTAQALAQTTLDSNGKRFYTIAQGDSLSSLAYRFYGNASEAGRIFEANTDRLSSPNLIRFGQQLYIPG